ncbi:MAG: hypothetical protein GY928_33920 [Colwellia sp.]|nr:hypothetical protein [Colwellia sp.]
MAGFLGLRELLNIGVIKMMQTQMIEITPTNAVFLFACLTVVSFVAGMAIMAIIVRYRNWRVSASPVDYEAGAKEMDVIFQSLLPYAIKGITQAYKASERALKEVGQRLTGEQKAEVAGYIYDKIPDEIYGLRVKEYVSKEDFAIFIGETHATLLGDK